MPHEAPDSTVPFPGSDTSYPHCAVAFGLRWDSDVPLHQFAAASPNEAPSNVVVARSDTPLRQRQAVVEIGNAALCSDGVRYRAGREAMFDLFAPGRIDWFPGEAWSGTVPAVFFSTLTAILLAWRGGIPVHGSAVEIGGQAVLVCGESGAGKSTLAAGLIALGARLISDDLSVLHPAGDGEAPELFAGRAGIKLFPRVAGFLEGAMGDIQSRASARGKRLVLAPSVEPLAAIPLAAVVVLDRRSDEAARNRTASLLDAHLFRPGWMRAIPGSRARSAVIRTTAERLRVVFLPIDDVQDSSLFLARARIVIERLAMGRVSASPILPGAETVQISGHPISE